MKRGNCLLHVLLFSIFLFLSQVTAQLEVGEPAPDFTLQDKDGNSFTLSDYEGKIVMLEFIGND